MKAEGSFFEAGLTPAQIRKRDKRLATKAKKEAEKAAAVEVAVETACEPEEAHSPPRAVQAEKPIPAPSETPATIAARSAYTDYLANAAKPARADVPSAATSDQIRSDYFSREPRVSRVSGSTKAQGYHAHLGLFKRPPSIERCGCA